MEELEAAGWKKAKAKKVNEIRKVDIRAIFNLVDVDRSGSVSRSVRNMRMIQFRNFKNGFNLKF